MRTFLSFSFIFTLCLSIGFLFAISFLQLQLQLISSISFPISFPFFYFLTITYLRNQLIGKPGTIFYFQYARNGSESGTWRKLAHICYWIGALLLRLRHCVLFSLGLVNASSLTVNMRRLPLQLLHRRYYYSHQSAIIMTQQQQSQ